MPETVRVWVEIVFNISYLIVIWALVVWMITHRDQISPDSRSAADLVWLAFLMLAIGDTGHVGFRVLAYALGGLQVQPVLFGYAVPLVGLGALSTAITVTIFYMLMILLWKEKFNKSMDWFAWAILLLGAVRLALMTLPQNEWNLVVPPPAWSIVRNLPLTLQGIGVAYLILRDAWRVRDIKFRWIGIMILVSYACYLPVILFVQRVPALGMLMIPKTMAYVAIALIAKSDLFVGEVLPDSDRHDISVTTLGV